MDRLSPRFAFLLAALGLAMAIGSGGGCRTALTTAALILKGTDVDPEFPGLKQKKVAVVCRPVVDLTYKNSSVAKDLARQVAILLKERVPKIEVIDQRKVDKFTDETPWNEYTEVGEAVGADMVVAIDLRGFTIFQSQTLYQGKADVEVNVYPTHGDGQPVFQKTLPQLVYPPNTGIPTSERTEPGFRREFVDVLADAIGRHFYRHDPHSDCTMDAASL